MNHLDALIRTIRNAKNNGRHDGIGNPIIAVDLYQASALNACNEIESMRDDFIKHCKRLLEILSEADWSESIDGQYARWISEAREVVGEHEPSTASSA